MSQVCIFMDDQLLRGNRTVKSNSSGLDAFESPNYPALAHLETGLRYRASSALAQPKGRFRWVCDGLYRRRVVCEVGYRGTAFGSQSATGECEAKGGRALLPS